MSIATLSIDLVARLAKLQEGMDKAEHIAAKTAKEIESRWGGLTSIGSAIGTSLAGAFSVGTVVEFTRRTVDAFDALNDAAAATGATVENLSALEDIARRNGGTLDEVTGILVKFNGALKEADGKNGASLALQALGLSVADLKREDPAEALRQVGVALAGFADDGNKARLVQELFGKSVKESATFLRELAEQGRLVATITKEEAEEAKRFNDALNSLETSAGNVGRTFVSLFIPRMTELGERMEKSARQGTFLWDTLKNLATWSPQGEIRDAFMDTLPKTTELERLQRLLIGAENAQQRDPENERNNRRVKWLRDQVSVYEELNREAQRFANRAGAITSTVIPAPKLPSLPDLAGAGGGRGGKLKMGEPYGPEISDEELAARRFMGPLIDINELTERNERLRELNNLLASTPTAQMERLVRIESDLNEAFANGQVGSQGYAEALEKLGDLADLLDPKLKKLGDTLEDFATRGRLRIEAQLGDSLYQALSGNFDNIGKAWGDLIKRIFAERLSKDFIDFLIGSSSGSSGDTLTKVFAFFGGGRAAGGPTQAGKMYEVNETGVPELFDYGGRQFLLSGKQPGYVHPLAAGGAGGRGGVTSSLNVSVGEGVSLSQVHAVVTGALKQQEGRLLRLSREGRL